MPNMATQTPATESRLERMARLIFQAAIDEGRCAELLDALFDGGTATVSPNGKLVIIGLPQIQRLEAGTGG